MQSDSVLSWFILTAAVYGFAIWLVISIIVQEERDERGEYDEL